MTEEKNNVENAPIELYSDDLIVKAEQAEKRIEAVKRIKKAALAVTSIHDWVDQNGKPYLQVSGSEKVARLFGISWQIDTPQKTIYDDGHFSYTYKGYFYMGSASIEFEGARSSKDGFFSKSHGSDIPPSEIDENNVKKAALTNTIGNGVTRLLGLRGLTWEDLKSSGIDRTKVGKIEYEKKEMSKDAKDERSKIGKMLLGMAGNDKTKASTLLMTYTSFIAKDGKEVKGKSSLTGLSEKSIPVVYGKVKKIYEDWQKEGKVEEKSIQQGFEEEERKEGK